MLNHLAERYKTSVRRKYFNKALGIQNKYAFVGTGIHATTQLYPILQHLGVPLKYILSRNIENCKRMCEIYKNCVPATHLSTVSTDPEVKGVFVCTTPSEHFAIAKQLLANNKHVFIEKPPCKNSGELFALSEVQSNNVFHVNFQQRFSPAIVALKKIALKAKFYRIEYLTGLYTEGDVINELFIHPLDVALHLFGRTKNVAARKIKTDTGITYLVQTEHENGIVGEMKLSTAYSWQTAKETIEVHTDKAFYSCNFPFELKRTILPTSVLGIPVEKILKSPVREELILNGHTISTSLPNHTSYLYGFYQSVEHFINKVERNKKNDSIDGLRPLYELIGQLQLL